MISGKRRLKKKKKKKNGLEWGLKYHLYYRLSLLTRNRFNFLLWSLSTYQLNTSSLKLYLRLKLSDTPLFYDTHVLRHLYLRKCCLFSRDFGNRPIKFLKSFPAYSWKVCQRQIEVLFNRVKNQSKTDDKRSSSNDDD